MGNILQALPQAATHLILVSEATTPLQKVTPSYSTFFYLQEQQTAAHKTNCSVITGGKLGLEVVSKYVDPVCLCDEIKTSHDLMCCLVCSIGHRKGLRMKKDPIPTASSGDTSIHQAARALAHHHGISSNVLTSQSHVC